MNNFDRVVLYGSCLALVVIAVRLQPLSDVSEVTEEVGAWTRAVRQTRTGLEQVGASIKNIFTSGG
ncbi:MAG TPA: hypothetical protein VK510_03115 [Solirubrobacteraceae bacterium]|nr:hypothetical protein [Solirubrobacteraceae bacterium]